MICPLERQEGGSWKCPVCGYSPRRKYATPPRHLCGNSPQRPVTASPTHGPGTTLKSILSELGIKPTANCGCDAMVAKMNQWGADGCRLHREEILTHLHQAYNVSNILTKLKAGILALGQGLPLTLEGLLDEAIQRAEAKVQ